MDFSEGELVRIRSWDDMALEFGIDEYGNIPCCLHFNESMRVLCGNEFTIEEIVEIDGGYVVTGLDMGLPTHSNESFHFQLWNISTDMIEHVIETEFPESQELDSYLEEFATSK